MAKPESAAKELRKLEKRLAAARVTESKRLRQLASAEKARKQVSKRQRQAAEAATEVASLAARIARLTASGATLMGKKTKKTPRMRGCATEGKNKTL